MLVPLIAGFGKAISDTINMFIRPPQKKVMNYNLPPVQNQIVASEYNSGSSEIMNVERAAQIRRNPVVPKNKQINEMYGIKFN